MERSEQFLRYIEHIGSAVGRSDRRELLTSYCQGLMLPLKRKSVEPLAANLDRLHVSSLHQALNHFVAQSPWSDDAVLAQVTDWVLPRMDLQGAGTVFRIADDTGMPKQGTHSVGVARQYCGQLGKTDNCQVAVSLSIATETASLAIKYVSREEEVLRSRATCDAQRSCRKSLLIRASCREPSWISSVMRRSLAETTPWPATNPSTPARA